MVWVHTTLGVSVKVLATAQVFFCRYCETDCEAFQTEPLAKVSDSTRVAYQKYVKALSCNVEAKGCGGIKSE